MPDYQPLINGLAYSWSQVDVKILGVPVAGITAVNYEETQEMQNNYGAGNRPVSRAYGKIEPKATVTLEMAEVVALIEAAPKGTLQSIPEFDIVVSFLPEGGKIVTHVIHNCRFMDTKIDVKQGDMTIPVELAMLVSHITWK